MRDLVHQYIDRAVSRRAFVQGMTRWGFSLAAVSSILDSLAPFVDAAPADAAAAPGTPLEGTGGELLVAQLHAAGVRLVFNCNGSGSYPIFDALVDRRDMHVVQVLQEGQMIAMAQGYALASEQTAFTVNASAGLPNTLNNLYNAWRDRTPLVVGAQREPGDADGGGEGFEEWDDYLAPSASFTRWRWSVDRPGDVPEITRRAFRVAATPPEGPVALAYPTDVLAARGRATIVDRATFLARPRVRPEAGLVGEAAKLLVDAKHPLLLVGPEVTRAGARRSVIALAEQLALPVAQAERLFADFPTDHPLFLGAHRWWVTAGVPADLVVCVGARLPPGRALPAGARMVHATIDPDVIAGGRGTALGILGDVKETADDLVAAVGSLLTKDRLEAIRAPRLAATAAGTARVRRERETAVRGSWNATPISWYRVGAELDRLLDPDAIVVPELAEVSWVGLPENAALAAITFAPDGRTKIGRTMGSALGWGVGAAIGVKLGQPDRQVVALQGDGGFMFGQAESLWTMARHEVPVIVVVFNNRSYNGPRNKILQARGRQAATGREMTCWLGDPDVNFAEVARGFGVRGEVVTAPDDVAPAIERAIASTREGRPYLLDVLVARTGLGASSTWYPAYSVAARRDRKV
jgi:benzoylformate decarboxylase